MTTVSEHVERLIVRRLDGELSAEEHLELDRELIRDPAARALFERYAAIDTLAGNVLARCATPRTPSVALSCSNTASRPSRDHARAWWMIAASAMAACLAIYVTVKTPRDSQIANSNGHTPTPVHAREHQPIVPIPVRSQDVGVWGVPADQAPRVDRNVTRQLIVVPAPDGSTYWINLDQVRQLQQKQPAKKRVAPLGDPI